MKSQPLVSEGSSSPELRVMAPPAVLLRLPSGSLRKAFSQAEFPSLFIRYARDGSKVEHSSWAESDLALEDDGHGVSVDRQHTPYLAR